MGADHSFRAVLGGEPRIWVVVGSTYGWSNRGCGSFLATSDRVWHESTVDEDTVLARLRELIEAWPETSEKLSHGSPTWWGGRKTFVMFHNGSYDDGSPSVWFLAPEGAQEALIASNPDLFYRPKYLGPRGWVGMRLRADTDWDEVRAHLVRGYRMVAPKRALAALDGSL